MFSPLTNQDPVVICLKVCTVMCDARKELVRLPPRFQSHMPPKARQEQLSRKGIRCMMLSWAPAPS